MGAAGLLALLGGVRKDGKVFQRCRGQVLGIDSFGWLHQLCLDNYDSMVLQEPRNYAPVVHDFAEQLRIYLCRGVVPLLVFDGRRLCRTLVARLA